MTLEQAQALSDEEIRVKVAEICGYRTQQHKDGTTFIYPPGSKEGHGYNGRDLSYKKTLAILPNYPADLNACADMERALDRTETGWSEYADYLEDVTGTDGWEIMSQIDKRRIIRATARQRCEAFLATMGKDTP